MNCGVTENETVGKRTGQCRGNQEEDKDSRGASFWDVREKVEMGK
jgi:hypothetical protein